MDDIRKEGALQPEGLVTLVVPKAFQLTLDDHTVIPMDVGEHEVTREVAVHPYTVAAGAYLKGSAPRPIEAVGKDDKTLAVERMSEVKGAYVDPIKADVDLRMAKDNLAAAETAASEHPVVKEPAETEGHKIEVADRPVMKGPERPIIEK